MKLLRQLKTAEDISRIHHFCPGCNTLHDFAVDEPQHNGAQWTFDGNIQHPTFQPSMHIRIGPYPARDDSDDPPAGSFDVCHYFLHHGILTYLNDCTHTLQGQKCFLPDLPEKYMLYPRLYPEKYAFFDIPSEFTPQFP